MLGRPLWQGLEQWVRGEVLTQHSRTVQATLARAFYRIAVYKILCC